MEYLRSIGCNMVQGYVFAGPLPADEFDCLHISWTGSIECNINPLERANTYDHLSTLPEPDEIRRI